MLPLIVIGAPDAMRTALQPFAEVGRIEFHPTAEAAHYALTDAATLGDSAGLSALGEPWPVHVAYGPLAYGELIAGGVSGQRHPARLWHGGYTLVLTWMIDPDPGRPRRVVDGQVADPAPDTRAWQAAASVSADKIVDVSTAVAVPFLRRYLEWKGSAS